MTEGGTDAAGGGSASSAPLPVQRLERADGSQRGPRSTATSCAAWSAAASSRFSRRLGAAHEGWFALQSAPAEPVRGTSAGRWMVRVQRRASCASPTYPGGPSGWTPPTVEAAAGQAGRVSTSPLRKVLWLFDREGRVRATQKGVFLKRGATRTGPAFGELRRGEADCRRAASSRISGGLSDCRGALAYDVPVDTGFFTPAPPPADPRFLPASRFNAAGRWLSRGTRSAHRSLVAEQPDRVRAVVGPASSRAIPVGFFGRANRLGREGHGDAVRGRGHAGGSATSRVAGAGRARRRRVRACCVPLRPRWRPGPSRGTPAQGLRPRRLMSAFPRRRDRGHGPATARRLPGPAGPPSPSGGAALGPGARTSRFRFIHRHQVRGRRPVGSGRRPCVAPPARAGREDLVPSRGPAGSPGFLAAMRTPVGRLDLLFSRPVLPVRTRGAVLSTAHEGRAGGWLFVHELVGTGAGGGRAAGPRDRAVSNPAQEPAWR